MIGESGMQDRRTRKVSSDSSGLLREASHAERRRRPDRRRQIVRALLMSSFMRRRRGPRRVSDVSIACTDSHQPQWVVVGFLILLLCLADALLTLTLLGHGALEVNPVMAELVSRDARVFVAIKLGLTAGGVVLLILTARVRAFGRLPVGVVLYAVLVTYTALVAYEISLLQRLDS